MSFLRKDECPRALRERITKFGGNNPFGKPLWRVVLAQDRTMIAGGIFHEFDQFGPQFDLSKPKVEHIPLKPSRVEHDPHREIPMYGHQGWILERWLPAHVWGDRKWWEEQKAADGITPLFGEYPSQGDYWLLGGPWERIPELTDLENAIQIYETGRNQAPENFEAAMKQYIKDEEDAQRKQYEQLVEELEKYRRSEIEPVMKSTSLAAQGVRNEVQKSLGLKSHLGAGQ